MKADYACASHCATQGLKNQQKRWVLPGENKCTFAPKRLAWNGHLAMLFFFC